jgi:hypothetical protein
MINNHKYFLIFLFALSGVSWLECKTTRLPCLTPTTARLYVESMHLLTDTSTIFTDTILPAAIFIPITTPDTAHGTVYPNQAIFTNLTLSPDTTVSQWLFQTDTPITAPPHFDTITFYYKRDLQFISNACGYAYFYTLDSVHAKGTMIDSAHITNPSVTTNVSTKHLQIYIHHDF